MSQPSHAGESARPLGARKALLVAGGVTTLEYYDFLLYGFAASLIFGDLFFPSDTPLIGTLLALATFGTGFVVRPIGGILAGHWGDRLGRRPVLIATMISAGIATTLVGLLPTHATLGVWAPILLVALRLLQGLAVGGETTGATVFGVESAPDRRRGRYASFSGLGSSVGGLVAVLVLTLMSALGRDFLVSWGWRIAFLLGGLLTLACVSILLRTPETRAFTEEVEAQPEKMPVRALFQRHPREVVLTLLLSLGLNGGIYILLTYTPSYAAQYGWSESQILPAMTVFLVVTSLAVVPAGMLSDRLGRRPVTVASAVALALFTFLLFWAIAGGGVVVVLACAVVAGLLAGTVTGSMMVIFVEHFPSDVRYSGASVSYSIGAAGAGFVPMVATFLYAVSGRSFWAVPTFGLALALLVAVSLGLLRETRDGMASRARVTDVPARDPAGIEGR